MGAQPRYGRIDTDRMQAALYYARKRRLKRIADAAGSPPPGTDFRTTEAGDTRTTESGDVRVTE